MHLLHRCQVLLRIQGGPTAREGARHALGEVAGAAVALAQGLHHQVAGCAMRVAVLDIGDAIFESLERVELGASSGSTAATAATSGLRAGLGP